MKRLRVTDFGPIQQADVKFGDLTVLVGPQASGKSLFVQLYKLIEDAPAIAGELARYGFEWFDPANSSAAFSLMYFGGGLQHLLGETREIFRDGRRVAPQRLAPPYPKVGGKVPSESVFLIPAQRVLVLQDGWPRSFMAYGGADPYVIRQFSESIRTLLERLRDFNMASLVEDSGLRSVVDAAIYCGSTLGVQRDGIRRQVVLKPKENSSGLPYSVWSAGQREFTPLLLGLSPFKSTWEGKHVTTIVIEEPEMGLHPQAIVSLWMLILELLARNIRIIVSTHSPVIIDLVWAIRELSNLRVEVACDALCKLFGVVKPSQEMKQILILSLGKLYHTYFFNRTPSGVVTEDISTLDPGDDNENIAGWGGLSGFSGRIAQIVGEACSR